MTWKSILKLYPDRNEIWNQPVARRMGGAQRYPSRHRDIMLTCPDDRLSWQLHCRGCFLFERLWTVQQRDGFRKGGWARIRSAVGLVERRSFWLPAQVWGQNFLRVATCTGEWISTPLRDDRILTQPLRSTHPTGFD